MDKHVTDCKLSVQIFGIFCEVNYSYYRECDPYGTGDSPTETEVTIETVTLLNSDVNIYEILGEFALEEALTKIYDYLSFNKD